MSTKTILTVFAAYTVGVLAAGSALAGQTTIVLGQTQSQQCAAAAADAVRLGKADIGGIVVCDAATQQPGRAPNEMAAAYLNRGVQRMARGEYRLAVADYNAAIRLNPGLSEAYIDRGSAQFAEGQLQGAIADFSQALTLRPQQMERVYFDRALAREDSGDVKGAYVDYLKAAQLNPGWDKPKKELARFTVVRPAMG